MFGDVDEGGYALFSLWDNIHHEDDISDAFLTVDKAKFILPGGRYCD